MPIWAVIVLGIGCTQSPAELIVGTWQFDHLSIKEGAAYSAADSVNLAQKNDIIKESGLKFIFSADKSCTVSGKGNEEMGTYALTEDKNLQIDLAKDEPQKATIESITMGEIVLAFDNPSLSKELVHLKKVD
ncbi:hypothetical protein BH09BAC1_BH09BAC1_24050 [soil metagenome]